MLKMVGTPTVMSKKQRHIKKTSVQLEKSTSEQETEKRQKTTRSYEATEKNCPGTRTK
ncbi:hypothetical protein Hdeb2414_s0154g00815731 [Helianthus debilis subsp. tardiflorus]